ncbi:2-succinyl-5-enolpyruvyl-6-hydroxy-3-cyclohexene- 1-carboxylic-acid synthase [Terrabacter aerolatus]|uniref:2-succinyl-5-enolpyruvyl-6-hydroxy-3-cyclohexene-1-carboxylate synthase n=1 Tax=Terrabacter aerolatus TaxID=422442 RepID=A0A512D451_9MICO|nr:2-succinyl-5-enolpyruvyl-6-hydroxy-3-cyclohexene-1-carboxylic-acid synthase [Terrabacter aerolatus]GEO31239.1 2-succinyl-5-enolpyruvyl-6-hydroxy-3-cyclohexene- 1-carboxylate synthase [Terrabacter aerolatus]
MTGDATAPELALRVLQQLWLGGVRDVVLAPGSRSAPFALALDAADRAGDLRLHVRVDERSAGFLALGLTTGSRRPVAVVTTSGTAVGNLLPAVMEAHHTGRRVVVVSADRPDRLRGTGANQTTDQAGIFGTFAPCHDLTAALASEDLDAVVSQACSRRGPTQLNVQLDGDLLPSDTDPHAWWHRPDDLHDPAAAGVGRSGVTVTVTGVEASVSVRTDGELLPLGPRTVVVAGDDAGPAARLLAQAADWPLVAEPTSGARVGRQALRTGRLLLTTDLRGDVERVVVVGHPTLSRPVTSLISDPSVEVLSVRGRDGVATDPGRIARVLDVVPRVEGPDAPAWFDAWQSADARLSTLIDSGLAAPQGDPARPPVGEGVSPLAVAAVVGAAVAADTTLVVGSSNPVRDLDVVATPWTPHEHRFVVGNRGLAGIDGMVSTAVGVALGRPRAARSIAYLGDLTFLHDTNGLLVGPGERRPDLTVVVLSDDGGAIFSTLEQGDRRYASAFERVFSTPHGTDLAALCAAHHTAYERVDDLDRLAAALAESPTGTRVLEVPVSRADRRHEAAWLRDLARQAVPTRDGRP